MTFRTIKYDFNCKRCLCMSDKQIFPFIGTPLSRPGPCQNVKSEKLSVDLNVNVNKVAKGK